MQLHELQPKTKRKTRKRIGRGGKRGTYSGKGQKGQKSRAGRKLAPVVRELIKRYPKKRGYRFNPKSPSRGLVAVTLAALEKTFDDGMTVSPGILLEKKVVRRIKGRTPRIKIVATGTLTKKLAIAGCAVSAGAKAAIEKAGGVVR